MHLLRARHGICMGFCLERLHVQRRADDTGRAQLELGRCRLALCYACAWRYCVLVDVVGALLAVGIMDVDGRGWMDALLTSCCRCSEVHCCTFWFVMVWDLLYTAVVAAQGERHCAHEEIHLHVIQ